MMDVPAPLAVRRRVSFSEAIYDDTAVVEQVRADIAQTLADVDDVWNRGAIAVLVDPEWQIIKSMRPAVVVDAILAKRNLGTRLDDAELVIGLGPGFTAGVDTHVVIETNRGHDLGRIIRNVIRRCSPR